MSMEGRTFKTYLVQCLVLNFCWKLRHKCFNDHIPVRFVSIVYEERGYAIQSFKNVKPSEIGGMLLRYQMYFLKKI